MAILFDWYEDPKPSDKQQGENENTLHPRIKYNGSTGTDVLRRRIQEARKLGNIVGPVQDTLDFGNPVTSCIPSSKRKSNSFCEI